VSKNARPDEPSIFGVYGRSFALASGRFPLVDDEVAGHGGGDRAGALMDSVASALHEAQYTRFWVAKRRAFARPVGAISL
jgi:hypothetical protein